MTTIAITVNGEAREVANGATLAELVAALDLPPQAYAAAIDRHVVRRREWATRVLEPGIRIDLVKAIGGG